MGESLRGRRVLVLGLGDTGYSMARWLAGRGADVRVADSRVEPPFAERLARDLPSLPLATGPFRRETFDAVDTIAISPGVPADEPLVAQAVARGVELVGDVELFARARDPKSSVLAITGTNGKSTVTTMTGAMCRAAGVDTVVAGNIGLPVLDALERTPAPEVWVLELSSFQLETTASLDATAATMLNLSEDHLDRYASIDQYAAAKARIFLGRGRQVLNRDDTASLAMRLPGRSLTTFGLDRPERPRDWGMIDADGAWLARGTEPVMAASDMGVPGRHNAANALAAFALCDALDLPLAPRVGAMRALRGLPHRLEPVAEIDAITWYDDSKGTNVGATVAALDGLDRPCVLIAGGDGKGQDFTPLRRAVAARARAVVLIGRDAGRIEAVLAGLPVPVLRASDMTGAVATARREARAGDCVLLSPACASYDMFRNYGARGDAFAAAVRALTGVRGSDC